MKNNESILVLDLGTSYIKLLEFEKHGNKPKVKKFIVTEIPHELREIASVNDPSYVEFVKKIISQNSILSKNAIINISNHQLEVKNMLLPFMTLKELSASIHWEIKDLFSLSMDTAVVDYMVLNEIQTDLGRKIEVCVALLPKKIIDENIALLQAINLNPLAFTIDSQAAWEILKDIPELKNKTNVAIIDIGADKTHISVFENGKFKMRRNLPFSGNRLTSSIVSRVKTVDDEGLDIEKAEIVKCKYGIPSATDTLEEKINPQDIFAALRPSLEDLATELSRFLEFYKSEHTGREIEITAIYGGGAKLKGICEYLLKSIGHEVILPDISSTHMIDLPESKKQELQQFGLFLINAFGASLIKDKFINLLPAEVKEQKEIQSLGKKWIKKWMVFAGAAVLLYLPVAGIRIVKQIDLNKLNYKYDSLSPRRQDLLEYNMKIKELNDKTKLCSELLAKEPFWLDIFKELSSLIPDSIIIEEISLSSDQLGSGKIQDLPFDITGIVNKEGAAEGDALTRFLHNLESSKNFQKIKLEYSKESKSDNKDILEFKIGCDIKKI